VLQAINILVILAVYASLVWLQLSAGERRLRTLDPVIRTLSRIGLSIVHAVVGFYTMVGIRLLLNVIVHQDYRHNVFGSYYLVMPVCGGLFGAVIPWLPLLRRNGRRKR
jgi:hypothetical protein